MRLTKLLFGSLAALALIAVVLVSLFPLLDLGMFRAQIEAAGTEAFDRRLTIRGSMRLKPSLQPMLSAEDVRIGNPDWASRPDFAHIQRLEIRVALWPLLRGELDVLDVIFSGADVLLEAGPGDRNNFTFRPRKGPAELPDIDQFKVRDTVFGYRAASGELNSCVVKEVDARNTPGQPISVDGQLTCRDVPLQLSLVAGTPEAFASRTSPWPLELTVSTEDASLAAAGALPRHRGWDGAEFRIAVQAERVDSLQGLFGVALPVPGPFDFAAELRTTAGAYLLSGLKGRIGSTDIMGELKWRQAGERPLLKGKLVSQSMRIQDLFVATDRGSVDKTQPDVLDRPVPLDRLAAIDAELELDVHGVLDSPVPIGQVAAHVKLSSGRLSLSPWRGTLAGTPVTGDLTLGRAEDGAELRLAANTKRLDLGEVLAKLEAADGAQGSVEELSLTLSSHGPTIRALLQGADLSLKSETGRITLGDDKAEEPWSFHITAAEIGAKPAGPVRVSVEGEYRDAPVTLAAETMTLEAFASPTESWPISIKASSSRTTLTADGTILRDKDSTDLRLQATLEGQRLASLNPLLGASLPGTGPFQLSAAFSSAKDTYTVSGLNGRIGSTDVAGDLQWAQAGERPLLKGRLVSRSMRLQDIFAAPASRPAGKKEATFLDQPVPLDWLAAIDAELEVNVQQVLGSPVPIRSAAAVFKSNQGALVVSPIRAKLAGAPMSGVLSIDLGAPAPEFRLAAQAARLELGDLLQQFGFGTPVQGGADNVNLAVTSRGSTLRALVQQADLRLTLQRGRIGSGDHKAEKPWTIDITAAAIEAKNARPMKVSVNGNYQGKTFALVTDTVTLEGLVAGARPWPLAVSLQATEASLNARGSVAHPFRGSGFDLAFEITGKDLRELDPVIDFVIPLRGDYRVEGKFRDRANRYSLTDVQVRVGQSDIGGSVVFAMTKPRLRISASLRSQTIHYDDLEFVETPDEEKDKGRVIPDYALPVEGLRAADLDVDLKAARIRIGRADLGDLVVKATVGDGAIVLSARVRDERSGASLIYKHRLNVATDPPVNNIELRARDLDYGLILTDADAVQVAEGRADVNILLAGPGATQRSFLARANGHVRVTGGPGRIASRAYGLWSSDLVTTMLSRGWQRTAMMEINCIAGRIDMEDGVAKTDRFLLDTTRLTIAGSGTINLGTEKLDVLLAPRPKQARLVSAANPVRVTGTLANPKVDVTVLPRGRTATRGLLAGLANPALLIFAFSDTGSGDGNPCAAALQGRNTAAN
ncbi:MAG: AsmA family protein [Gammaproteobacteria bacterium]|nr:AsmA family protein [Gammaproteobacteria bacterium]